MQPLLLKILPILLVAAEVASGSLDTDRLSVLVSSSNHNETTAGCGYQSCPSTRPDKINVHIVAHTHDDVGWLKTVDQYYYGTKKLYNQVGVHFILDSVIPQLLMDKSKRFIYVEMSFFTKWWRDQDAKMQEAVKSLVNEGRLEFINGGWCMNDEATVTYRSTIEQMTLGLKFLNETFGSCGRPKVGWQIDPFGHTNEQASLFAQFGFDGMYFTRESWSDKKLRAKLKSLDLLWHGDEVLPDDTGTIFTSIFRDGYDAPSGFCFDVQCQDDNLVDNKDSYEYNMDYKTAEFVQYLRSYAASRATNHILLPMGGDFQYSAAGQNFYNIDKLIKHVGDAASDLNLFYSTPSCYQYELNKLQATSATAAPPFNHKMPEKFDDFMPYESSFTIWWSGYFTSRPSVKLVERQVSNLLPVARMVSLAELLRGSNWSNLSMQHEQKCLMPLWEVLSELQHHDAVTGTERQHVNDDYVRRASQAKSMCAKFIGDFRRRAQPTFPYLGETDLCPLLNISQCNPIDSNSDQLAFTNDSLMPRVEASQTRNNSSYPSETKAVLMTVYNPLAHSVVQHDFRLPCKGRCLLDKIQLMHVPTKQKLQLIRILVPAGISSLPFRDSNNNYEVLFYADLPGLSYTSFVLEDTNDDNQLEGDEQELESNNKPTGTGRQRRFSHEDEATRYEYFTWSPAAASTESDNPTQRRGRRNLLAKEEDKVIVKFDLSSGMISGLKRESDEHFMQINQQFGYYLPAPKFSSQPGAYIFRPNSSEPVLYERPLTYRVYKRKNGSLVEIHQKWTSWLWQTIRIDAKKNYIEFDYLVGPIPVQWLDLIGREVITRYSTSVRNKGVFFTDSNDRQLLPRRRLRSNIPEQLGGSFYPVVSTLAIKDLENQSEKSNNSIIDTLAIQVDRSQAGTSLHEGQLELLVHRRLLKDDNFGVAEPLNEPGEDGLGLVSRGHHRMYIKFKSDSQQPKVGEQPILVKLPGSDRANLTYEQISYDNRLLLDRVAVGTLDTTSYSVYDQVFNELAQESRKHALRPVLTFDRLNLTSSEYLKTVSELGNSEQRLLSKPLPNNVHLLTLQPWTSRPNEVLIRLESLDNPLTLHPFPDYESYLNLLDHYKSVGAIHAEDLCAIPLTEVNLEEMIDKVKVVKLQEMNLAADVGLNSVRRLDWRMSGANLDNNCKVMDGSGKAASTQLGPRQIRTFLATLEPVSRSRSNVVLADNLVA